MTTRERARVVRESRDPRAGLHRRSRTVQQIYIGRIFVPKPRQTTRSSSTARPLPRLRRRGRRTDGQAPLATSVGHLGAPVLRIVPRLGEVVAGFEAPGCGASRDAVAFVAKLCRDGRDRRGAYQEGAPEGRGLPSVGARGPSSRRQEQGGGVLEDVARSVRGTLGPFGSPVTDPAVLDANLHSS
jgi:hypothetical protein